MLQNSGGGSRMAGNIRMSILVESNTNLVLHVEILPNNVYASPEFPPQSPRKPRSKSKANRC